MQEKTQPIEEAIEAIKSSSKETSVYIGCDSIRFRKYNKKEKKYNWFVRFSTVVVVHKDSKHGGQIFSKSEVKPEYQNSMATRLLSEVNHSLEVFEIVKHAIGDRYFEIHLDINSDEVHNSNKVAKQALGWVKSYPVDIEKGTIVGDRAKLKPFAWAASHSADHVVRRPKK